MNIMQVSCSFPNHEACIKHLETVRLQFQDQHLIYGSKSLYLHTP